MDSLESLEKRWTQRIHRPFYPKPVMTDAGILFDAGTILLPFWLAKEVNAEPDPRVEKYSQDEPRNPAGSGDVSGRWTRGGASPISIPTTSNPELIPAAYNGVYHDILLDTIIEDLRARDSTVLKHVRMTSHTGITAIAHAIVLPKGSAIPYMLEVKTGLDPSFTINHRFDYPFVCFGGHAISADWRLPQVNIVPGAPLLPLNVVV